jgi:hypothetical protein
MGAVDIAIKTRRLTSRGAPTGHKLFEFISFSFHLRRWAHLTDQEMRNIAYNVLRVIALLGAVLLGSLPFLISFIIGIAFWQRWVACASAMLLTIGITLLSFWHPETFRFGSTDLKIHDSLFVIGIPQLLANLPKNVAFAYFGVLVGRAAREGYQDARSKTSNLTPDPRSPHQKSRIITRKSILRAGNVDLAFPQTLPTLRMCRLDVIGFSHAGWR